MPGPLTPTDQSSPNYSPSGSYGDPTLATAAKGEKLLAAMLEDLHEQVAAFVATPAKPRPVAAQGVL
jgi:creatinine amidohydrolase